MSSLLTFFNSFKQKIADGTIDLDSHSFKLMLTTSSYVPSAASHAVKADITNELAAANGYSAGGVALTSVVYTQTNGTAKFDADDVTWTASGGSLIARYAVLYDDTATNKDLICYILLDTTPADVTITTGNKLTAEWDVLGIFTLA